MAPCWHLVVLTGLQWFPWVDSQVVLMFPRSQQLYIFEKSASKTSWDNFEMHMKSICSHQLVNFHSKHKDAFFLLNKIHLELEERIRELTLQKGSLCTAKWSLSDVHVFVQSEHTVFVYHTATKWSISPRFSITSHENKEKKHWPDSQISHSIWGNCHIVHCGWCEQIVTLQSCKFIHWIYTLYQKFIHWNVSGGLNPEALETGVLQLHYMFNSISL